MKLCKDCKWVQNDKYDYRQRCKHPKHPVLSEEKINPVNGHITPKKYRFCSNLREDIGFFDTLLTNFFDGYTPCGVEGSKWEAKDEIL